MNNRVKVKSYTRRASIWDNKFIELATLNRTLAITAEQLARKPSVEQAIEYSFWKKKRNELESQLIRGL